MTTRRSAKAWAQVDDDGVPIPHSVHYRKRAIDGIVSVVVVRWPVWDAYERLVAVATHIADGLALEGTILPRDKAELTAALCAIDESMADQPRDCKPPLGAQRTGD